MSASCDRCQALAHTTAILYSSPTASTDDDLRCRIVLLRVLEGLAIRVHMKDFLSAIEKRGKPVADIEHGYISTTSCILANLSMQVGRALEWDPAKGQIVRDDEANKLLRRPYRSPWAHPEPATV